MACHFLHLISKSSFQLLPAMELFLFLPSKLASILGNQSDGHLLDLFGSLDFIPRYRDAGIFHFWIHVAYHSRFSRISVPKCVLPLVFQA